MRARATAAAVAIALTCYALSWTRGSSTAQARRAVEAKPARPQFVHPLVAVAGAPRRPRDVAERRYQRYHRAHHLPGDDGTRAWAGDGDARFDAGALRACAAPAAASAPSSRYPAAPVLPAPPPSEPPPRLVERYTMGGAVALASDYYDTTAWGTGARKAVHYTNSTLSQMQRKAAAREPGGYGETDRWLFALLDRHPELVTVRSCAD